MITPVTMAPGVISMSFKLCSNNSAKLSLIIFSIHFRLYRIPAHTGPLLKAPILTYAGEVRNGAIKTSQLQALTNYIQNTCYHLFYANSGGIHQHRILCRLERRDAAIGIALIA